MGLTNTTKNTQRTFFWHCPTCHSKLEQDTENLYCLKCGRFYKTVGGIPDLRIKGASWIDYAADLQQAKALWEQSHNMTLEELVRAVFSAQPGRDAKSIELRTRQL